jgi:hypothetical protein
MRMTPRKSNDDIKTAFMRLKGLLSPSSTFMVGGAAFALRTADVRDIANEKPLKS